MSGGTGGGDDFAFGSDSFLDVMANLVAVLIIITTIAGLRASQKPKLTVADAPPAPAPAVAVPEPFEPESLIPPLVAEETAGPIVAPEPPAPPQPSPELARIAADLRAELGELETGTIRRSEELRDVAAKEQTLRGRLGEHGDALAAEKTAVDEGTLRVRQLEGTLSEFTVQLRNLEAELEKARQQQEPVKTLRHRMTPLSRVVEGSELHFQLLGGRIAPIPVDELSERLKGQIVRQKDWLLKFPRHQGVVGPVGGFSMAYVVERTELSMLDHGAAGVGVMRIGVSEWTLRPEPDLVTESFEESLRPGSAFLRAVQAADAGATLTFWVYPDSFTLYRRLAEVCQREGFGVAARPLPFGTAIMASKNGTRSAAQ